MTEIRRPGPLRWLAYAFGAGLPARNRDWVLHDVTCRTWALRHFGRAAVQLAPFAVALYVVIPGESWVRAMAVIGGLLIGFFYSFAYLNESAEHRAMKAGWPQGHAALVRSEATADDRSAAQARYDERWR
ncbi:hypothetical protein GCM10009836_20070 [Pseudonocardia ailaonensis]|uniref:DUF5313 domain-containing protein n=1 Tax=Pseudonocardia ailaonensis TaxID=367279 RepID=A0ABN2MZ32_9PSEU